MAAGKFFFRGEVFWQTPVQRSRGRPQPMEPYYVTIRLPGETGVEFVLIVPFTPRGRENTIAWLAGRSDGLHFGALRSYRFPVRRVLVFGPSSGAALGGPLASGNAPALPGARLLSAPREGHTEPPGVSWRRGTPALVQKERLGSPRRPRRTSSIDSAHSSTRSKRTCSAGGPTFANGPQLAGRPGAT